EDPVDTFMNPWIFPLPPTPSPCRAFIGLPSQPLSGQRVFGYGQAEVNDFEQTSIAMRYSCLFLGDIIRVERRLGEWSLHGDRRELGSHDELGEHGIAPNMSFGK